MAEKKKKTQVQLHDRLIKLIKKHLKSKKFKPQSLEQMMVSLNVKPFHEDKFEKALDVFVEKKELTLRNDVYRKVEEEEETPTGVIRMHPRGFGFVQVDVPSPYAQDIFIPKHLTQNAVDGDRVQVAVASIVSSKGPEGKVLSILERGRTHLSGIVYRIDRKGIAHVHVPLLGEEHQVLVQDVEEWKRGDRVVIEVNEWGKHQEPTWGKPSHKIGNITDPSCDIAAAIEAFDLRSDFPVEVVQEAKKYPKKVTKEDLKDRVDYRKRETVTIDPKTAKDFDDALSLETRPDGGFELIVHIADVSHYVFPGSALDTEAYLRSNSTYFPGVCIPMLPEELSNELCSLKPKVDRLAASIRMVFDKEGEMTDYSMEKSVIHSDYRFSYEEAFEVLEGKKNPHSKLLQNMKELCLLLKKHRKMRGSIEFAVPEMVIQVDDEGNPQGFEQVPYDITHQMVEEFMLKANELVAKHLTEQDKLLTYRIHDQPDPANIAEFVRLAASFGFKISDRPTPSDFQKLFEEASNTPYGSFLVTSYIRSMKMAVYSSQNIGHFGLALNHYCHFTSPIRRYPDLVVHRILFGEEADVEKLDTVSARASDRERVSAKAEMHVKLLKKLRLLKRDEEKDPYREYEAVITRIRRFGIHFEVLGYELEGFFPLSEMGGDYYVFNERTHSLRGERTRTTLTVGTQITLFSQDVDLIRLEAKWNLCEDK